MLLTFPYGAEGFTDMLTCFCEIAKQVPANGVPASAQECSADVPVGWRGAVGEGTDRTCLWDTGTPQLTYKEMHLLLDIFVTIHLYAIVMIVTSIVAKGLQYNNGQGYLTMKKRSTDAKS